ncbi:hypothetical protein [Petropleomorpha daqingensis]|uniref:Uncharacterized protein n=1 Tax=Petropleomorpha daqingensis TaxID=2026353 RepID=A0A853CKW2_9ACTN|nr:hypothetical protein [Petropleomorpha daqingensis]NYJ08565.1 hypothetical protein [Petropleomorpha daqingensis]
MPIWSVQDTQGVDETIEAGLVATEGGALVALTDDGLLLRAWAPGHWRDVRRISSAPADEDDDSVPGTGFLVGLPRR